MRDFAPNREADLLLKTVPLAMENIGLGDNNRILDNLPYVGLAILHQA
jgi:hypothetical protein